MALEERQLKVGDLAYLIGYTTTLARLVPPNIALVAGPASAMPRLTWSCVKPRTGFANALVIAQGLSSAPRVKAVGNHRLLRLDPFTSILSVLAKT